MSRSGRALAELVGDRMARFPASGEINRHLKDPAGSLRRVQERYAAAAVAVEHVDGLSMEFPEWRFNLRSSNTEPVVRLNVESRGDARLMREKMAEILALLDGEG